MDTDSFDRRLRLFAVVAIIIGAGGTSVSAAVGIPAWQAALGGGHLGTIILTQIDSCGRTDRNPPPPLSCYWTGDFVSDDGKDVRRNVSLAGTLPPDAKVGDVVRARDPNSWGYVYGVDDNQTWKQSTLFGVGFLFALVAGVLYFKPWTWRQRLHPPVRPRLF